MDRATLATLYDQHAEPLFRYLSTMTHRADEARDWLQDVFVKLARSGDCLNGVRNERAFLFRLARNVALDSLRRSKTRHHKLAEYREEPICLFAADTDPDKAAFRDQLGKAMAALPADQRDVVYLKLYEDLTFQAIGEILEITGNTAASRYRYGLTKLRSSLRPLYDEIHEDRL